jgi:uncharacterized protein YqfB (UPF0267 family)
LIPYSTKITFYQRFEFDILAGKKTITIRDQSDKNFKLGSIITASIYKQQRDFCQLKIISVEKILFQQLNDDHATQENMSLADLRKVIQDIYPNTQKLYVISFKLYNN